MKIRLERTKCISCGSCAAVCPEHFEISQDDGSPHLKNSVGNPDGSEEIEVKEPGCARDASEVCPAQIIKVEN